MESSSNNCTGFDLVEKLVKLWSQVASAAQGRSAGGWVTWFLIISWGSGRCKRRELLAGAVLSRG